MGLRVGVVGASGYVGGELLRLLLSHPEVELTCATSRRYAGEYLFRVHANLRGRTDLRFIDLNLDKVTSLADLVFTSLPHGTSMKLMPKLVDAGLRIIDMAADFRLKDPEGYKRWYGIEHPYPDLLKRFAYGVPELHREEIRNSHLVAAPGCMAVTSILALAPLVKDGVIDLERIIVDAKIGSSGGGAKPSITSHHSERYGVIRPYKPVGHRHTGEIEQELSLLAGRQVRVSISPHAVNIVRGILCTNHAFLTKELSVGEVWRLYRAQYGGEPFIRLVKDKKGPYRLPDPKVVIGSNYCDIGFELDEWGKRVVVLSATDNLVKGAAGSGIQCMNVMMGFDERAGLDQIPLHPV